MTRPALASLALLLLVACRPGQPIFDPDPQPVGGTIAGIVSTDANDAVMGRRVTAINTVTGQRHESKTGTNGGYTIKVPQGTYRLEVDLLDGESLVKAPEETRVNRSDLDPRRDFVITRRPNHTMGKGPGAIGNGLRGEDDADDADEGDQ